MRGVGWRIGPHRVDVPVTWHGVPVGADAPAAWRDDIVGEVGAVGEDADALRHNLELVRTRLRDGAPLLAAAVWIPEPRTAAIAGVMRLHLLVSPSEEEAYTLERREAELAEPEPATEIARREQERTEVPLGPALVTRDLLTFSDGGSAQERIEVAVVPDGCAEGLALEVLSQHLFVEDELLADVLAMADRLQAGAAR